MAEVITSQRRIVPERMHASFHQARVAIRSTPFWARHITPLGKHEVLPAFLVIGGQRCGTSTFLQLLSQHPRLVPPKRGEVHFFDLNYRYGLSWYRACFPSGGGLRAGRQLTFDVSPYYIFHPAVPARVAADLPQVRIIVLLRDPTRRAFSHWVGERRKGRESCGFEEALRLEGARLSGDEQRLMNEVGYCSFTHRHQSYVARGHYALQISRWLKHIDRKRMLFIKSETLFADPQAELLRVWGFLGVEPLAVVEPRHRNRTDYKAAMAAETRDRLTRHFREANRELPRIAGEDFVW